MSRRKQTRSYGSQREFHPLRSRSTYTQTPKGPVPSTRGQWPPIEWEQRKAARAAERAARAAERAAKAIKEIKEPY